MRTYELAPLAVALVCLVVSLGLLVDWHRVRRWCWTALATWAGLYTIARDQRRCMDCGVRLTPEEHEHYGFTCERCEVYNFHAVDTR